MAFRSFRPFPGVWHIQDAMGVCMTLLAGRDLALLVDTGYGAEDIGAYVRALTDRPLTVMLTHGHHDHALGSRWFSEVYLLPEDFPVYTTYTGDFWRRDVWGRGREFADERFLTDPMPPALPLAEGDMDLGALTARIIPCPGHTPGSAVVYVPEYKLLLTGDNWNPCTWLFFREALSARDYRANVERLLALPFEKALCAHQFQMYDRDMPESLWRGITDEALSAAVPSEAGQRVGAETRQVFLPKEQVFVFDWQKFMRGRGRA